MINLDFSLLVTILYVAILYLFMKKVFFEPVLRVLSTRKELIAGRMENAQRKLHEAEGRVVEYEQALKKARSDIYREQEGLRESTLATRAELVTKAKAEAETWVRESRHRLESEAETARKSLESEVDSLARKLTTTILKS
jgi:F0F1-type ATP synthase membrane subunit b/b'